MAQDSDAVWRAGTVALLGRLQECVAARDVGGVGHLERHDVEIQLEDGTRVAVEVTRVLDSTVVETYAAFDKHGTQWPWPGTASWTVFTTRVDIAVKRLRRELPALLQRLESLGIEKADGGTWVVEPLGILDDFDAMEPLFNQLTDLGIRVVERRASRGTTHVIHVWKPPIGAFAAEPRAVTARLLKAVESKTEQLRAAKDADGHWVVLWVDLTALDVTMALERVDWAATAPHVQLPDNVDRLSAVVPRFGNTPHFLVHSYTSDGWSTTRVPQEPVHAAMAPFGQRASRGS